MILVLVVLVVGLLIFFLVVVVNDIVRVLLIPLINVCVRVLHIVINGDHQRYNHDDSEGQIIITLDWSNDFGHLFSCVSFIDKVVLDVSLCVLLLFLLPVILFVFIRAN